LIKVFIRRTKMDKVFSAFKTEFRLIVSILVPGGYVAYLYYKLLLQEVPGIVEITGTNSTTKFGLVFFAALVIGLILEDLGSRVENVLDYAVKHSGENEKKKKEGKDFASLWNKYLQLAFTAEPVGQRYLRTILTRMKFELGMGLAFFVSIPATGTVLLAKAPDYWACSLTFVQLCLCIYLLWEAYRSHKVLAEVRERLVEGIRAVPETIKQASEQGVSRQRVSGTDKK